MPRGVHWPDSGAMCRFCSLAVDIFGRVWAILLCSVAIFCPPTLLEGAPSLCLFVRLFGWECPGCGISRAMTCAMHGQIQQAVSYNIAVIVVLPIILTIAIRQAMDLIRSYRQVVPAP